MKCRQDTATDEAFFMDPRLMATALLTPVSILGLMIMSASSRIRLQLGLSVILSSFAFLVTSYMVPRVAPSLVAKLFGVDIGKRGLGGRNDGEKVPESLGIVSGTVFMVTFGVTELLFGKGNVQLNEYNAALLSICFAILLGLVDDVIDIKWRHKILLTAFMTLPLLLSYSGPSTVLIPSFLTSFFEEGTCANLIFNSFPGIHIFPKGNLIDLGFLFYVYMFCLVIFCTNSINIYAGINGLEVGQSVVTAVGIAMANILDLLHRGPEEIDMLSGDGKNHLFSLMIMIPFIATSLGLLRYNFYPASVFVGDVYPYYAGMCFATASILGHFSKSLLLFMLPQLINFAYSLPQLLGMVPCPRHRLPRINLKTGFLEASFVAQGDTRTNMTLLCLTLRVFGPMHERTLCIVLLCIQSLCSIIGIAIRQMLF